MSDAWQMCQAECIVSKSGNVTDVMLRYQFVSILRFCSHEYILHYGRDFRDTKQPYLILSQYNPIA
jgi:hypothetical protein